MKKIYEKPNMLIERFIPTQSIAANCGTDGLNYDPVTVQLGDHICLQESCGHEVKKGAMNYDKDNNGVTVFNSYSSCELCYDTDAKNNVAKLGQILTGSGSWNSHEHAMVINGVRIPS